MRLQECKLSACIYHVMGHNEDMFLFLVQDEVRTNGCVLLNGHDGVLLHLPVWAQEHLRKCTPAHACWFNRHVNIH